MTICFRLILQPRTSFETIFWWKHNTQMNEKRICARKEKLIVIIIKTLLFALFSRRFSIITIASMANARWYLTLRLHKRRKLTARFKLSKSQSIHSTHSYRFCDTEKSLTSSASEYSNTIHRRAFVNSPDYDFLCLHFTHYLCNKTCVDKSRHAASSLCVSDWIVWRANSDGNPKLINPKST